MNKLKVTKEQFYALEDLKKKYSFEAIINGYTHRSFPWADNEKTKALRAFSLEKLATALIAGYEVIMTEEEKLVQFYATLDDKDRFDYAYKRGIDAAINAFKIKVKGINE